MRLKIKTNNQTEINADDDIYPYHLIDTDAAVLKSWGCFETMMDANDTHHDFIQLLREVKEIPSTGHREVARREIIRLEAENAQLQSVLNDVVEFSNNEAKSKRAKWAINKARQVLNAETEKEAD